jgi:hypothetical protein
MDWAYGANDVNFALLDWVDYTFSIGKKGFERLIDCIKKCVILELIICIKPVMSLTKATRWYVSPYRLVVFITKFYSDLKDFSLKDKYRKKRRLTYQKNNGHSGARGFCIKEELSLTRMGHARLACGERVQLERSMNQEPTEVAQVVHHA